MTPAQKRAIDWLKAHGGAQLGKRSGMLIADNGERAHVTPMVLLRLVVDGHLVGRHGQLFVVTGEGAP